MDATPRNLNEDRNEGTHEQVVALPSLSRANVTYADVFDTDDECDSDSDISLNDEESTNYGEVQRDPVHDIISNGLTANLMSSTTGTPGIDEDTDRLPVSSDIDQVSRKGNVVLENKFVMALMNAVQSYSTSLRSPSLPSTTMKALQSSSRHALPRPLFLHELESEESDGSGSESDFSSDTFDDKELLSNRPTLDADQAARLLYRPSDPWAEAANVPIENPVVIAKLNAGAMCEAYIKRGILGGCEITYISKTWLLSQEWEGFFSELALYSDPTYLRPLQGDVIPKIIGFYVTDGAISVAMELPSPEFWVEASEDMSNHLKRKCIAAFDAIHERGVLHNDVELRHMLISSRGDVTVIDFQESRALKPVNEVGLKAATEAEIRLEKRKVRFKLNYGDSRARESQKRRRVLRREDQKREVHISRAKRAATGQSLAPPGEDEESEPEDPDDVFNPIVDPETWMNCWIDEPCSPTCCIVPGQDKVRVGSAVQEFLMEELDRQEKDEVASANDHLKLNVKSHPSNKHLNPITMPVLPTRINLKRDRDLAGDTFDDVPSPKKRQLSQANASVVDVESAVRSDAGSSAVVACASLSSNSCTDSTSRAAPSTASPTAAEVHVPFEGYIGSDGFIIPNVYSSQDLGRWRQIWIKQYNIQRCIEDGLPYPLAELENMVPSTIVKTYDAGRNGKITKRRPTRNRGAMRRAQLDTENPGKRKRDAAVRQDDHFGRRREPGTGLRDTEDEGGNEHDKGIAKDVEAEGPRILPWQELLESRLAGNPHSSLYSTTSRVPRRRRFSRPKVTAPSRGILRRQLNSQEKARNVAYLEMYKKSHPPEPDDDDDRDSDRPRAAKRARLDSGLSGTQSGSSSSGGGVGFQRYSTTPNAFAARLDRGGGSMSSSGSRSPSPVTPRSTGAVAGPSVAGPSMAGPLPSDDIPRRVGHNPPLGGSSYGGDQFSARASVSSLRLSDVTSESDSSSDGNDQEPSSSVWPSRRRRRYHRRENGSDFNLYRDTPYFYCIPLEGLPPPAPLTEEDLADMAEVEELIVVDNGTGWPWANFTFSLPWRWQLFR